MELKYYLDEEHNAYKAETKLEKLLLNDVANKGMKIKTLQHQLVRALKTHALQEEKLKEKEDRINKAIEYIEDNDLYFDMVEPQMKELLEILRGEDEDTPKEDKKIAKIGKLNQASDNKQHLNNYILRNKINEIIDRLNGVDNVD